MPRTKVAVTIDSALLTELDRLIAEQIFPSRSQAIQAALRDKLARMTRGRLAAECAKLDVLEEQRLAEEGIGWELASWPEY